MNQIDIFPIEKTVSDKDIKRFVLANSGNYTSKNLFYLFKGNFLRKYGKENGFDLQVIEKKCWACSGTAMYSFYGDNGRVYRKEPCYKCLNGVYYIKNIILKRYVINDSLFHIPVEQSCLPQPIINTIYGLVVHKEVDNKKALAACVYLLAKHNQELFLSWLKNFIARHRQVLRAKQKFSNIKWNIARFINSKQYESDLPF